MRLLFASLCMSAVAGGCADPGSVVASSASGPGCGAAPCEAPSARSGDISAGYRHSCWIDAGGALYCWGGNIAGEVGDGTTEPRPAPVQISPNARWKAVATGGA